MFTAPMFIFFWEIPKYVQAKNSISPLTAWPTWVGILWKGSMLTKLAGYGEWAIPEKKTNRGGGWGYRISRGIKEIACGISRY